MNYHRVAVQLLTWGIRLSHLNDNKFEQVVYERASKSLDFLDASYDSISGYLPNYGNNDGALFFKLTSDDYREYTSQLNDLRLVMNEFAYDVSESSHWLGYESYKTKERGTGAFIRQFEKGGYYILQEQDVKTFIKCGHYKDRPAQSDNLHVDIWVDGNNVFRDSGTYKYNTSKELSDYFNGCEGHNTISLNGSDQMLKGGRFIWYYWVKKAKAKLTEEKNNFLFTGAIQAFRNEGKNIVHSRKIEKRKGELFWEVTDTVEKNGDKELRIFWHLNPDFREKVTITCMDNEGVLLAPIIENKWFSGYYGFKEESVRISFKTTNMGFRTQISIKI
jgi:hypothetical protein